MVENDRLDPYRKILEQYDIAEIVRSKLSPEEVKALDKFDQGVEMEEKFLGRELTLEEEDNIAKRVKGADDVREKWMNLYDLFSNEVDKPRGKIL